MPLIYYLDEYFRSFFAITYQNSINAGVIGGIKREYIARKIWLPENCGSDIKFGRFFGLACAVIWAKERF
jgi:hypothetical protein